MPSASNVKVEKQQSSNANAAEIVDNNKVGLDGNSAIGQVYNSIAHKIRNLEKRKVSKPNGEIGYCPFWVCFLNYFRNYRIVFYLTTSWWWSSMWTTNFLTTYLWTLHFFISSEQIFNMKFLSEEEWRRHILFVHVLKHLCSLRIHNLLCLTYIDRKTLLFKKFDLYLRINVLKTVDSHQRIAKHVLNEYFFVFQSISNYHYVQNDSLCLFT